MRGLFCVDPGSATGVAWGIVDDQTKGKAIDAVKDRLFSDSTTISGDEMFQIRALWEYWAGFRRRCVYKHCMKPEWCELVIEDFILFPGEKPGRNTTVAERIAWGFNGYRTALYDRHKPSARDIAPIHWQQSGAAHRFAQREILEAANAWIRGKEHERSAFAHMILRTNILLDRQH